MAGQYDMQTELISAPGELPMRLSVTKGKGTRFARFFQGGLLMLMGAVLWSGENPFLGLLDPEVARILAAVVVALGAIVAFRGASSGVGKREFRIDETRVEQVSGPGGAWAEQLDAYLGVRWRRSETLRTSDSNSQTYQHHIVELAHEDPARNVPLLARTSGRASGRETLGLIRQVMRSAQAGGANTAEIERRSIRLSRRTSGADIRDEWEAFATLLAVPAIDARGDQEEIRAPSDLDKSIGDLAKEGKISRDWDDRPAPPSLKVSHVEGDNRKEALEIGILASSLPQVLLPVFVGLGGLIVLVGLLNLQLAPIFAGFFFVGFPLAVIKIDRSFPRTLTVTRAELTLRNPRKKPDNVELVLPLNSIERVHIERRSSSQVRGPFLKGKVADALTGSELVISTDNRDHRVGAGLDDEALFWLRDYIVSALANA